MVSLTQWTWVWASSGSWWGTGKPGVLQSMGSQRVKHNWVTEPNWFFIFGHDSWVFLKTSVSLLFVFVCFSTFLNTWGIWVKHIYIISSVSSSARYFISSFLSLSTDWFFSWWWVIFFYFACLLLLFVPRFFFGRTAQGLQDPNSPNISLVA